MKTETLNEYLENEYANGRGVALIDSKTGEIFTPYLGSEYGPGGWSTPSEMRLDGDAPISAVRKTGAHLLSHSGGLEIEWREQRHKQGAKI